MAILAFALFANADAQALLKEGGFRVTGANNGQTVTFNGTTWVPSNITVNSASPLQGTGTSGSPLTVINGTAAGQILKWNGTAWALGSDNGDVYTAGTGINITGSTISNTGDLEVDNEGLIDIQAGGANTAEIISNTAGSTPIVVAGGTGITVSENLGTSTITVTNAAPDQTVSISGSGISVSGTYPSFALTASDISAINEGLIGVGAGGAQSTTFTSNTSGQTPITFEVVNNSLQIAETTGANGGTITLTGPSSRVEAFTATASQTSFTLAGPSFASPTGTIMHLSVKRNGVNLRYVASGPNTTQFTYSANVVTTSACDVGDSITVEYIYAY